MLSVTTTLSTFCQRFLSFYLIVCPCSNRKANLTALALTTPYILNHLSPSRVYVNCHGLQEEHHKVTFGSLQCDRCCKYYMIYDENDFKEVLADPLSIRDPS